MVYWLHIVAAIYPFFTCYADYFHCLNWFTNGFIFFSPVILIYHKQTVTNSDSFVYLHLKLFTQFLQFEIWRQACGFQIQQRLRRGFFRLNLDTLTERVSPLFLKEFKLKRASGLTARYSCALVLALALGSEKKRHLSLVIAGLKSLSLCLWGSTRSNENML